MQKFQVDQTEVQTAILSEEPQNQLKIAYNLIVDNKRFADANAMYRWDSEHMRFRSKKIYI